MKTNTIPFFSNMHKTYIVFAVFMFLLFTGNRVHGQTVNLPCQDETIAVEDLERKDFETPSGSTNIHSQGSMHNFTLPPASDFGPCKIISNISISIDAIGVDLTNLPQDCIPTPTPYYYNIALGCIDFTPASCDTDNLLGEDNTPTFTDQNFSYNGDFDFGDNLSVDIVPVMNINCTAGQTSLTSDAVILDYEICVTVTIIDGDIDTPPDLGNNVTSCPSIDVTLDPGAYSSYAWSTTETTPTIDVGPGVYMVTVTDANGCTDIDNITVGNFPISNITIDPSTPQVCDNGNVNVSVNEFYSSYMWSTGASGQTVSLSTGNYDVTITDANNCEFVEAFAVGSVPPPSAGIDNFINVCNDGTTYDIQALLLAFDIGGTWTDDDLTTVDVNTSPTAVSFENVTPGTYTYTYTVTGSTPCPNDEAVITVTVDQQNNAGTSEVVQFCQGPGVLDFYSLISNPDLGGVWTDSNGSGLDLTDPFSVDYSTLVAGSYNYNYLIPDNGVCSAQSSTLTIIILASASAGFDNEITVCEGAEVNLFDLVNGANSAGIFSDPNGNGGLVGNIVNTTGLNGLSLSYLYTVGVPGSPCGQDDAIFTVNVESSVSAGGGSSSIVCLGGDLDLYDYLVNEDVGGQFFDIDGSGGLSGNILSTDAISAGTYTYEYEIGDNITCPKDSTEITFIFSARPTIDIVSDTLQICQDECLDIEINITGAAPFEFPLEVYASDGTLVGTETIITTDNNYILAGCNINDFGLENDTLNLLYNDTFYLAIPALTDQNCSLVFTNDVDKAVLFTVTENSTYTLDTTACITDTLRIDGLEFFVGNESYNDTIPGARCDSIIMINVTFSEADTAFITDLLCPSQTIPIGGITYGINNPMDTILTINPNSCDSVTVINISFYPMADSLIMQELCPDQSVAVGSSVYDISNPNGIDTLFGESFTGCDSIVTTNLTFSTTVINNLIATICLEDSIIVGTDVYNIDMPAGTTMLTGAGCDTTVIVDLSFFTIDEGELDDLVCADFAININGTTYDLDNPSGQEILEDGSVEGCDSTVNINLQFEDPVETFINRDICDNEMIDVNGTVYDQGNPFGTEIFFNVTPAGCDSTVFIDLNVVSTYAIDDTQIICDGDSSFLQNAWQFAAGTFIDTLQSTSLCDSVITTELVVNPCQVDISLDITDNVCVGDSSGRIVLNINSEIILPYTIRWEGNNGILDSALISAQGGFYTIAFLPSDSYVVSITDGTGTVIFVEFAIISDLFAVLEGNWTESSPVLCFDSTGTIEFVVTGGEPLYNYSWSSTAIGNTSIAQNVSPGNYTITVTDDNGCVTESSYTLDNAIELDYEVMLMDPSCMGVDNGLINITDINGGAAPYSVMINDSLVLSNVLDSLATGTYEVQVMDINGCVTSSLATLTDVGSFMPSSYSSAYTISQGDSVQIIGTGIEDSLTYIWNADNTLSCIECSQPVASPEVTTTYNLVITNGDGCVQEISVLVQVEIPENIVTLANIFSPNGDNVNDEVVFNYGTNAIFTISIFDRWGNLMHSEDSENGTVSWDGFYNNTLLDSGVYVYVINLDLDGVKDTIVGNLTLLR